MKVLVIGPSPTKSKGGMATVIDEIRTDGALHKQFEIDIFESYVDGGLLKRLFFSAWAYLKFCFTKRGYDVYHIHAASYGSTFRKGLYAKTAKRWGKKVIFHIHGGEYMKFYEESSRKKEILRILKSADKVIALSAEWKKRFVDVFGLENCVVLRNGINIEKLQPAVSDPANHPHSFVTLSRFGEKKGSYDFIAAVELVSKEVPDVKCYMAGDGEIDKCEALVKEKGLEKNILVVGWANYEKKLDLLTKSAVLVLPSYDEGLPMSVLEGMACGKAIISTTVGAIPEVVKKENGILVSPGDVKALSKAMLRYCNDENAVQMAGQANIQLITEQYSMEAMHHKLAEIYASLE